LCSGFYTLNGGCGLSSENAYGTQHGRMDGEQHAAISALLLLLRLLLLLALR